MAEMSPSSTAVGAACLVHHGVRIVQWFAGDTYEEAVTSAVEAGKRYAEQMMDEAQRQYEALRGGQA